VTRTFGLRSPHWTAISFERCMRADESLSTINVYTSAERTSRNPNQIQLRIYAILSRPFALAKLVK
jgi:hypothetical protein